MTDELEQLRRVARAACRTFDHDGHSTSQGVLEEAINAAIEEMGVIGDAWQRDSDSGSHRFSDEIYRITHRFRARLELALELSRLPVFSTFEPEAEASTEETVQ